MDSIFLYSDNIGKLDYVDHMGDDLRIVNAARVSFGKNKESIDSRDEKLIKYLAKHQHTSTFEHNIATFRCKVPLFVRSQHHRHRTWSYNEISRRYTDFNLEFYAPKSFRTQHDSNRQASNLDTINPDLNESDSTRILPVPAWPASDAVRDHHRKSLSLYNQMIKKGVCREQARGILPQNLYTEYYATCNLSNLLKFIKLRTHSGAQWEIRVLAESMLSMAKNLWPIAVGSFEDLVNE